MSSGHRLRRSAVAPAAAAQELVELLGFDAGQHGGVADLVAVEMQDRQHRPVADRVEELGRLPRGRQRPRLGLTVADHARHDQAGIVEHRPERVTGRSNPARRPRESIPASSGAT